MEIPVYTVDAFTNLPFKGNPAAVCLLENELKEELYQKIAAEMNLSETAFIINLKPTEDFCSGARFGLRWFTPTHEVNLCGHATLASAAVLFYKKENTHSMLTFETLSGELMVRQRGEALVMDFPLNTPEIKDKRTFNDILNAAVGDLPIQEVCYCKTTKKLLVRLPDTCDSPYDPKGHKVFTIVYMISEFFSTLPRGCGWAVLTSLSPVTESLLKSEDSGRIKSLIITVKGAASQPGYDFFSRNFAPWVGIPEDPVTGSAHTVLAAYWSEKLGKKKMLAYQCSKRGGELELELRGDNRVDIAGRAVVLLQGILKL